MTFKNFFHYISYIQYPLMITALFFAFKPYLSGFDFLKENPDLLFKSLNLTLVFMGLGISFSSLQDTTKTQNNFSLRVWENPKYGKIAIITLCCLIVLTLLYGMIGYFTIEGGIIKDLSIGAIVLSLGMFGLLKTAVEMFENHRKDKNTAANTLQPRSAPHQVG